MPDYVIQSCGRFLPSVYAPRNPSCQDLRRVGLATDPALLASATKQLAAKGALVLVQDVI